MRSPLFRLIPSLFFAVAMASCSVQSADTPSDDTSETTTISASSVQEIDPSQLVGSWRGAFVKDRGTLAINLEIAQNAAGELTVMQYAPDWIGYPAMDGGVIALLEEGEVLIPDALRGGLTLQFDPIYRQMVGATGTGLSAHFVRALPRLPDQTSVTEVEIPAGDITLAATLSLPQGDGPHPAMIVISGRGCWGRGRSMGRVLPDYDMAVLEYDKRGTGESTGDCDTATFENLVDDAVAALEFMRADPRIDAARVGLQGGSAGAWTAQGVAEKALQNPELDLPAFIVTYIGPATSIERQQREAGEAIADQLDLSPDARASVMRAVDITLDQDLSDEAIFTELNAIADQAEAEGWRGQMFDVSDIPASAEAVDDLWLRRFSFDPQPVLRRLSETPYLSLLGAEDAIVPLPSNSDALREALEVAGNESYKIVIIPGTGHGVEHGDRDAVLPDGSTYQKFDTVEPLYFTEVIDFLRAQNVIETP